MIDAVGINKGSYGYSGSFCGGGANILEERLQEIKDEQGILGNLWNGVKEITTLGVSASDCESKLEEYKNGKITLEEAMEYLNEFDSKQENMSGLLSNIATGVGTIALVGTGSLGWAAAFLGKAPIIGAAIKSGLNLIDRATNKVEGDALDAKQIAKDVISGAVTGATSAVTSNIGQGFVGSGSGSIATSTINGIGCGVACGGISGATSYMSDVAFGDKEFDAGELVTNTATSALVSGFVGGTVGAGMYGVSALANSGSNSTAQQLSQGFLDMKECTRSWILSTGRKIGGNGTREAAGLA